MAALKVWLVGASAMAFDYAKVLAALNADVTVIGRGEASASQLREKISFPVVSGGLERFLSTDPDMPDAAIVAVGVEGLAAATRQLLMAGVRRILLEKPGALHGQELRDLHDLAASLGADVVVGYNRRMYASVEAARTMIEEDGGIVSMNFEFTEWSHLIEKVEKAPGVKEAWLLGNSTHVIDLAFHLGGAPVELHALVAGSLAWHPSSAVFAGAGRTDKGVLFSYQANWDAPGRWGVELLTMQRRLIFRPMESLQVMKRGSVAVESAPISDAKDREFKPGLFRQVERFLAQDGQAGLCTLREQVDRWPVYEKIAGYGGE